MCRSCRAIFLLSIVVRHFGIAQQTPNELPYSSDVVLGSGYDLTDGTRPTPFELLPTCTSPETEEACITNGGEESVFQSYLKDVRSHSDHSGLESLIVGAEGGGFGISISAGFQALKSSKFTEQSIAFYIGASFLTGSQLVQNPQKMRLQQAVLDLLKKDPLEFLRLYGTRYVFKVVQGGSFLGFAELHASAQSTSNKMSAFVGFSVNKGLFSAGGSASFTNAQTNAKGDISVNINMHHRGGSIEDLPKDVEGVGAASDQWFKTVKANPATLKVVLRPWLDLAEIANIVLNFTPSVIDAFSPSVLQPATLAVINDELSLLREVQDSTKAALNWNVVNSDAALHDGYTALLRDSETNMIFLNSLDESGVNILQASISHGNYSWATGAGLRDRYLKLTDTAKSKMAYTCFNDRDLHGGDEDTPRPELTTLSKCAEACNSEHGCRLFVLRDSQDEWKGCWLKRSYQTTIQAPGYNVISCTSGAPVGYECKLDVDYFGGVCAGECPVKGVKDDQACAELCSAEPNCTYFVQFPHPDNLCWLKSGPPQRIDYQEMYRTCVKAPAVVEHFI